MLFWHFLNIDINIAFLICESKALAPLILNKLRVGIKACAIKAPGFGKNRKTYLQDLAILKGQPIPEELGLNLEKVHLDMLDSCKKCGSANVGDVMVIEAYADANVGNVLVIEAYA
ncbi:hypothetical protein RIF29_19840 [Crotalaria pallida]|uniref:Chaperonin 60 n=1 Tax=Crotalaria pallida TaxID=3830 RepID=A0AAN9I831_CROPI